MGASTPVSQSGFPSYLSYFWHKYEPFWALGWTKMDGCYSFKGTIKQLHINYHVYYYPLGLPTQQCWS
jgi:hypothetical protein